MLVNWLRVIRLATDSAGRAQLLPLVAEITATQSGADAALVVLIQHDRPQIAATHGCDMPAAIDEFDPDALGSELGDAILAHYGRGGGAFRRATSVPLISDAALFGSIVVLSRSDAEHGADAMELLAGIADIAAAALSSAAQFERLERANAEVTATRAALQRAEKLRALGEMAAGLSHDLKNILNPLGLFVQLALRQLATGSTGEARASLQEMRAVVERCMELLERLRHFSRQTPDVPAEVANLDSLAQEAVVIASPRASRGRKVLPRVVKELGGAPPLIARSGEVVAALVNLIANAQDALPGAGTITIRTGADRGGPS